jgi:YVTN family beta-propeller protein
MRRAQRWMVASAVSALAAGAFYATAGVRTLNSAQHPKSGIAILVPGKDGDVTMLHNGWRIRPAGRQLATGDMLVGGAFSPDGKIYAIANAGYGSHGLHLIDVATEKEIASIPLVRAWSGIAWASNGSRLYISGGTSNGFHDVNVIEKQADGTWKSESALSLGVEAGDKAKMCVGGLALSKDESALFALDTSHGKLYSLNSKTGEVRAKLDVGDSPIACRLGSSGTQLYVAEWGGKAVAVVDVTDSAAPVVSSRIPVGDHPNDLTLSADGRLFVSCGNDDSVTVVDVASGKTLETVKTSLTPNAPSGSTPVALALAPDGKTLYVANADNNDVAVLDVSRRGNTRVTGFIPTGWYATAVAVTPDGKRLITASGKGAGTHPNPAKTPINPNAPAGFEYIGKQLNGIVSFVDAPSPDQLASYTKVVRECSPYDDKDIRGSSYARKTAIPKRIGDVSPIKYVLYIIKENRTYDQVYGDMPKGNGDASLCLFGREVTPNQHALADQFVLLDNLYCNGEVSQDGHPWSTSAICVDYEQRAWVLGYSGKGKIPEPRTVADPKAGYLWQAADAKGLSIRNYGEMRNHPSWKDKQSEPFIGKVGPNQPPPGRDWEKADIFINEFKEFEKSGTIPRLMVMSLGENHTRGTTPGAFTPKASVASNDLAVGKIVDAISHSSVWNQFAIFIIEDDAQNGPDHVDSHRTAGLVISPYTRRHAVDSTMYSTASMLRTIELILGLKPLTQYDAAATPMFESFIDRADLASFTALQPQIDINAKNVVTAYGARESARMDFSEYDRADFDALNRILWRSIKGAQAAVPAPVRRHVPDGVHAASIHDSDD